MVVISLSENVFDLGITQIPLFKKLVYLFESVGAVSVLVGQMVYERLLFLNLSSISELVLFFVSLFLDFVGVSL